MINTLPKGWAAIGDGWTLPTLPKGWVAIGDGWTVTTEMDPDPNFDLALECAQDDYQTRLVFGRDAWSGATLHGKAKAWDSKYRMSKQDLLRRFRSKGVVFSEQTLGKRQVLVIGDWPDQPFTGVVHCIDDLFD